MKKVMCIICFLLLLISGCQSIISAIDKPYHEYAWARKGKSIPEVRRAVEECIYEVSFADDPDVILFHRCMNLKGYFLYSVSDLEAKQYSIQQTPGWSSVFFYNDVAGKTNW